MPAIDPVAVAAAPASRPEIAPTAGAGAGRIEAGELSMPFGVPLRVLERQIIEATIAHCDGSIPRAAAMLEVSPSTIYRKKEGWEKDA